MERGYRWRRESGKERKPHSVARRGHSIEHPIYCPKLFCMHTPSRCHTCVHIHCVTTCSHLKARIAPPFMEQKRRFRQMTWILASKRAEIQSWVLFTVQHFPHLYPSIEKFYPVINNAIIHFLDIKGWEINDTPYRTPKAYKGSRGLSVTKPQISTSGETRRSESQGILANVIVGNVIFLVVQAVLQYLFHPKGLLMRFCLLQVLVP